jgi:catechol 2,3-dioxygenase-like lactoylglutathione lyase family enzyme
MIKAQAAFSGFSVNDLQKAKVFYTETLGLELKNETMGLDLLLPGGGSAFVYQKDDHKPATYTMLNFVVENIDEAVDELKGQGVKFEHYDDTNVKTDDKGIARGKAVNKGPDIAWFKDPAENIISVLQI